MAIINYAPKRAVRRGYRAVSDAELDDIAEHGFRPHPEGKSMQEKWFSETREALKNFRKHFQTKRI